MTKRRTPPGQVRPATKSEAHRRALKAMNERTAALQDRDHVVRRLMELEVILAALVAREGRVRLTVDELTADYTELQIRPDDESGCVVLECNRAKEAEPAPGEKLAAVLKGGFSVVENLKGEGA